METNRRFMLSYYPRIPPLNAHYPTSSHGHVADSIMRVGICVHSYPLPSCVFKEFIWCSD